MSNLKRINENQTAWWSGARYNDYVAFRQAWDSGGAGTSGRARIPAVVLGTSAAAVPFGRAVSIASSANTTPTDPDYIARHVFTLGSTDEDTVLPGIAMADLADEIAGPVCLSGVCCALVTINDAGHGFAKTTSTAGELESTDSETSIVILYAPGTGTDQLCKVFLGLGGGGGGARFYRTPAGGIPASVESGGLYTSRGSATCDQLNSDGTAVDSGGATETVFNPGLNDIAGTWPVLCMQRESGEWEVIVEPCPVDGGGPDGP